MYLNIFFFKRNIHHCLDYVPLQCLREEVKVGWTCSEHAFDTGDCGLHPACYVLLGLGS